MAMCLPSKQNLRFRQPSPVPKRIKVLMTTEITGLPYGPNRLMNFDELLENIRAIKSQMSVSSHLLGESADIAVLDGFSDSKKHNRNGANKQ